MNTNPCGDAKSINMFSTQRERESSCCLSKPNVNTLNEPVKDCDAATCLLSPHVELADVAGWLTCGVEYDLTRQTCKKPKGHCGPCGCEHKDEDAASSFDEAPGFFFLFFFFPLITHNAFRQLRENTGSRLGSLAKVKCGKAEEWSVFYFIYLFILFVPAV